VKQSEQISGTSSTAYEHEAARDDLDEAQLALLKAGAETWNAWRKLNPDASIHLSGADLREVHLSNADLKGADLRRADLRGVRCYETNFSDALMHGTNLTAATVRGNFSGARLVRALLPDADLMNCVMKGAILEEADLSRTKLAWVDFSDAWLVAANVTGARGNRLAFGSIYS
jgi:uncharacterized protein YjbI with pentapeptide repeats